jgi:hypothetical protein
MCVIATILIGRRYATICRKATDNANMAADPAYLDANHVHTLRDEDAMSRADTRQSSVSCRRRSRLTAWQIENVLKS